jgi:hypothetical protein
MAVRKSIPTETKLRLFSAAAGHCQNPDCLRPLFPAEMGGDKHIAEMAHMIPHGDQGPRHEDRPDKDFNSDSFDNLILLCPTCHTIIDKDPSAYPRNKLLDWKTNHLASLANRQGVISYQERKQVRDAVISVMAENRTVWAEFAPVDGRLFNYDPESESAITWTQRMRSVILPNHFRIQAIIQANSHLMNAEEHEVFAQYKEHVRGLSARHICGVAGGVIRYPVAMDGIFS